MEYTPNLEGEGSIKVVETQSSAAKVLDDVVHRLYSKGLVSTDNVAAGFGVAICDQMDELLFEMKESVSDVEGVKVRALIRGLSESLDLGIRKIVIYCDDNELYQNITSGKCKPKQIKVVKQLIKEVQRLREKFASSEAILVAENDIKFAFELAREAIVSQTTSADDDGHDGDNNDDEDDNPWAYGCGCDWCLPDPPTKPNYDADYIEFYSL
ncbi:putative protein [Arabidopsis thaliana]|uniref:Reverse transcriptase-like protein n=1 Tax=Arabidopsis thaliana TaxID=3702 RepID=Q9M1F8_ARATH|nr:reverse transcriptase-like protein [Arabidopsis thaliana]AAX23860.1 hypothetical protein At3g45490 [Arabidopsis thaliana]AAZ52723.1 hypothetical protein At3g45490 [Arabidopsis thaliana]AEE78036.1 reverse transcriptase-like protein [Arabidopsis thaliana]CAB75478.1 putative protein [Arabidopsis thaliana]|eukprot:NP_190135.1 reverse transcriptase-like protein [Arabidopsis thaliana]